MKPEKREDGYYHDDKKITHQMTVNGKGQLVYLREMSEDGMLRLVLHNNWDGRPSPYRTAWLYEDGTASGGMAVPDEVAPMLAERMADETFPPVSGGSDDDETACGELCQQRNDAAWAKLGPVDEVELPF